MNKAGLLALSLALTLAAAACGDGNGGPSALNAYFEALERASNDAEARLAALPTPSIAAGPSFETARDSFAQYYDDYATATEDVITEFDALAPPDEAADEHRRFIDTLRDLTAVTYTYASRIRDATSEQEFQDAFLDTDEGEAAGQRVTEACNALQALADERAVEVDLDCGE